MCAKCARHTCELRLLLHVCVHVCMCDVAVCSINVNKWAIFCFHWLARVDNSAGSLRMSDGELSRRTVGAHCQRSCHRGRADGAATLRTTHFFHPTPYQWPSPNRVVVALRQSRTTHKLHIQTTHSIQLRNSTDQPHTYSHAHTHTLTPHTRPLRSVSERKEDQRLI